jgi:hypothetical protein
LEFLEKNRHHFNPSIKIVAFGKDVGTYCFKKIDASIDAAIKISRTSIMDKRNDDSFVKMDWDDD